MAHPRFSLWGQFRRISSAALAVTLITPGSSHAQAIYLDFSSNGGNSSGYWSLSATDGDFYQAGSILVATDGGVVNSNSPANENWGWGDSRDCDGFGCGGPIVHLTTVTFVGDINLVDFFDFGKVTILQNDGGMTFTADKGLSRTFAAGDIGLKTFDWTGISVLQIHNLASPSQLQASSNIHYAYIDNLQIIPIPEPELYAMISVGLGMVGFVAWRRKRAETA